MSAKFPRGGGSRTFFSSKSNSVLLDSQTASHTRPPDKSEQWKITFIISQPKHMLWVLK